MKKVAALPIYLFGHNIEGHRLARARPQSADHACQEIPHLIMAQPAFYRKQAADHAVVGGKARKLIVCGFQNIEL